ncbi:MAG: FAD-dependent oxidoreductase [Clostridium sp.]
MPIRIHNIQIHLDENINSLKKEAARKLKVSSGAINDIRILKESVDARKQDIKLCYHVEVDCQNEESIIRKVKSNDVFAVDKTEDIIVNYGNKKLTSRPVVVGSGPCGMFAALLLAQNGYKPILLDRGVDAKTRKEKIDFFYKTGILDVDSNIQFGEGGAGTFSDGKLTTRIKDPRCTFVLKNFIDNGAPSEIIYSGKPHIGTDILIDVVENIRKKIIELGGEVRFSSKVTDIIEKDSIVKGLKVNGEVVEADVVVLAIGHSSRDTYEMLLEKGLNLKQKAFAIGARVEHHQSMIDENQYGSMANHPKLKAAEYRLTHKSTLTGRPCYSFCMCPGGIVVAAASEENRLVVNGMSEHKRDGENANSAIVVGVTPDDFESTHPLAGMEYQRMWESKAFEIGGGSYTAPVQNVSDFIEGKVSKKFNEVKPSYTRETSFKDIGNCLPAYVTDSMKEALVAFNRKIKGFSETGILTGIETRTSAPVTIDRDELLQSPDIRGIYPAGEGAGYAGGIMSAAVDGLKVAQRIMETYKPLD